MLTWQNTGDPCTPETVTSVNHLMPTRIGFTTALGPYQIAEDNPGVSVTGATSFTYSNAYCYLDATQIQQMLFTVDSKIYRHPSNTNVSRVSPYTGDKFSFTQWRDRIYGANGADVLQKAITGSFADVSATAPKFTRIAVAGEFLAGIGLVADYVGSARTVTASPYILMISGVGNPDQFDVDVDTSAYFQDVYDSGGPLTAIARLRNFFVVFQKSGVYVVENVGGAEKWSIRCVSNYFGCELPDSVIEVNNVLYWISPTRGGEVCSFDGSQVQGISTAIDATVIGYSASVINSGFPSATTLTPSNTTSATDGETILWNRVYCIDGSFLEVPRSIQLYLNVATGRFGMSSSLNTTHNKIPWCVTSNSYDNAILCVKSDDYAVTPSFVGNFYAGYMAQMLDVLGENGLEFFRGSEHTNSIVNLTPRFSEYSDIGEVQSAISSMADGFPNYKTVTLATPILRWLSTKRTGDSTDIIDMDPIDAPMATWNTTTGAFDIPTATTHSKTAKTFAFKLQVQPVNSITGITIDAAPAGTGQTGAKAVKWQ